jgi:small subunit ribosomal protein S5e
MCRYLSFQL